MIETSVMRELAVPEVTPNLGNLGGSDGRRLDRLRTIAANIKQFLFPWTSFNESGGK